MADNSQVIESNMSADSLAKMANKKMKAYTIGFVSLVILTLVGYFAATASRASISSHQLFTIVSIVATLQLLAIVMFFFRSNVSDEDAAWNWISFVFTMLIVAVIVAGSLWIMYSLNYNMVH